MKWIILSLYSLAVFTFISSCAVNPVTGKQELMLLSERDEMNLGKETDGDIIRQYGLYEDPKLAAYVQEMANRMGRVSHRPHLAYECKILDVSVVNAFAVPGGFVYFTRGILAVLNSEAELAGVMGHEIGHITARHSARQYSRAQLAQLGLGLGSIFVDSSIVTGLAQLGVGMLFLRFSRDHEREADDLGVEYASKAGYDGAALARFFESLEKLHPESDRSGLPGWFSTHPSPENRIPAVRNKATEWQQKLNQREYRINREGYLKMIDGLIYGDDPRQGYVAEGVFYHPILRFQFPVPPKWKVNNKPSQVQIVHESGEALILFLIASETSSRDAVRAFVSKNNASVIRTETVQVHSLPAQRLLADLRAQTDVYRVLSYFIEKDRKVYVFHGISPMNRFQNYGRIFESTMERFRELTDPKRIDVRPDRIRIQMVRIPDTLENSLLSLGISKERIKEMVFLNGGDPNQWLTANSLVKVVEKGR